MYMRVCFIEEVKARLKPNFFDSFLFIVLKQVALHLVWAKTHVFGKKTGCNRQFTGRRRF